MEDITARQRRILDYIRMTVRDRGYPPTVRVPPLEAAAPADAPVVDPAVRP